MDQTQNQKEKQKQSLSEFIESRLHSKPTQLLLSVSVFSLFLSHSYCLSLLHSLNSTFHDTLAFKFLSHSIDKNFIFLLCNGLLVFLAKYSGLVSSSSKHNLSDDPQTESTRLEPKTPLSEKEIALETTAPSLKNSTEIEGKQEDEEDSKGLLDDPFAEDIEESESYEPEEEEDDEELVEGNKALSTEEMNKRFDEFIRKMKEELRIEARQQVIMV